MKRSTQQNKTASFILVVLAVILTTSSVSATLLAPSVSSTSATLTWTAPGDDGDQGIASGYDIRYATFLITDANWDLATSVSDEPAPQPSGSSESFTVQNLQSNTTYYFAIKVHDEVPNWSVLSNVISVTTLVETAAPSIIVDISSPSQTANSITLNWTAPGDDGTSGTATQYDIRYSTSPITSSNWDLASQVSNEPTPGAAGSIESVIVTNLSESTVYYFAIKTSDEVPNWSGLSNILSISTTGDQTPPDAINDLQASAGQEHGELTLSWTAPGDDGLTGRATAYLLRYSTEMITESNWMDPVTDSSNFVVNPLTPSESGATESYTITDLTPGSFYYVAIKSIDESSNSSELSNVSSEYSYYDLSLGTDDDLLSALPDDYHLLQNYPNPFNPTTEISFALPENSYVTLDVFNSLGQKVNSLVSDNYPAGNHTITWNGTTDNNQQVASGIYFYKLTANNFNETKKMVMLK